MGNNFSDFLFAFSDNKGVYSANRMNDNFSFTSDWKGLPWSGKYIWERLGKSQGILLMAREIRKDLESQGKVREFIIHG